MSLLLEVVHAFINVALIKVVLLTRSNAQGILTNCSTCEDCAYPAQCKVFPVDNAGFSPCNGPFFDLVMTEAIGSSHQVDNGCVTFFRIKDGKFMTVRSSVFKNGTYLYYQYIRGNVDGHPGIARSQGQWGPSGCLTCVINDYVLGQPCPGVWVFYRCYIFGYCVKAVGDRVVYFATSNSPEPLSECCYSKIRKLMGPQALPIRLPHQLPRRCVVSMDGAKAINADRVPKWDRVYL